MNAPSSASASELGTIDLIVLAIDCLPKIGGISLMTHHLCNALARQGNSVVVVAPDGASVPETFVQNYELVVDRDAKPGVRDGVEALEEDRRIVELLEELRSERPIKRVLIMHPFYYAPGAITFARSKQLPSSLFFYGFELNSLLIANPVKKYKRTLDRLFRVEQLSISERTYRAIDEATDVLAISKFTADLIRLVNPRRHIPITGCGLSEEDISLAADARSRAERQRADLMQHYEISTDRNISFCARLVECKGGHVLLQALAKLGRKDVGAIIVGDGPERAHLENLAVEQGLKNVRFFPAANDQEKFELMALSDAFCLPSYPMPTGQVEGFGIVLLEAAAAGVPVVASRAGGMTDVVRDNQTGLLFPPQDSDALADCFDRILKDSDLAAQMVKAAQKQIENEFNWPTVAQKLSSVWPS